MTLGAKLEAEEVGRAWQPIQSFPADPADEGLSRLIDAMSTFGVEMTNDASVPSGFAPEFVQLGAMLHGETAGANHRFSGGLRAALD